MLHKPAISGTHASGGINLAHDGSNRPKSGTGSSLHRFIQATLDAWEHHGQAATSARSLALAASLPVSSLYHHFGSLEHLFLSAQDHALADAERWCAAQINAIAGTQALSPDTFPALLAALIDDWSHQQRRAAFAWRECHLLATGAACYLPALDAWCRLWTGFWGEICARCGLGEHSQPTAIFFDSESLLHLMRWRRPVDRACLDETCRGWALWLAGSLAPEGPWRGYARSEAIRTMPDIPIRGGMTELIARAAADAIERRGISGLTHRGVAALAGVSLGVVSYNFRTSADLARAAFEMIYRRILPIGDEPVPIVTDAADVADGFAQFDRSHSLLRAIDELLLAVARDPSLQPFAPQLRYLRGRSSGPVLQAMIGDGRTISPLDAALFSGFSSGFRRATVGKPAVESEQYVRNHLGSVLNRLGRA